MKDFQIKNNTELLFRNDPLDEIANITKEKNVLFVYGGGSVHKNGCYDDVKAGVQKGNGRFFEFGNVSRELSDIQKCINFTKENQIDIIIGAGGANVMDATKIISFAIYNDNYLELIKENKNLEDFRHVPLILMPTYPSSGSEYDSGAVGTEKELYYLAWGLTAEYALLVPKYSLSLNEELTTYSSLVTLIQLCVSIIGDKNPVSYDIGISVVKNVLKAAYTLKSNPNDLNARGSVLYGASISTSSWLGLGKEDNFLFEIYYIEIMAEALFKSTYRKTLTILFPRLLKFFSKTHEEDIKKFLHDAFGLDGSIDQLIDKIIQLFSEFGIDMCFHNDFSNEDLAKIKNLSSLTIEDISSIFKELIK